MTMDMRETIRKGKVRHGLQAGLPWACYEFPPQFPGFDGHFPGQPVLPGVCMLKTAVVTLEDWHGQVVQVEDIRKARFLSPISPGQSVEIKCTQHGRTPKGFTAHLTLRGAGDRKTSECIIHYSLSEAVTP